ncbi:MAG TPA: hypothetical protein VFW64_15645 [Pseudonocardiaceae bacterium]|nr:hypothetical protein [Pseudonocardiaceae bacterium]
MTDATGTGKPRRNPIRRVIDIYCSVHGGARGFTPLVCRKVDDLIELDPHATNGCVLIFDEKAATELFDVLGEWLG